MDQDTGRKQEICNNIQQSLVDFCEGALDKEQRNVIKEHIDGCKSCEKEYLLTKKLLASATEINPGEKYFENMAEKISDKISVECKEAQEYITYLYTDEAIPAKVAKHLQECAECKQEALEIVNLLTQMHKLSVPMPNERFFQQQLYSIDRIIETLPSKRIAKVESGEVAGYFAGIFDVIRTTIMQPYAAIAVSAMVVLLVVGARFYSSKDSIEEKQINLSEVINKNNSVADRIGPEKITDPSEDERIQMNSTGTAKKDTPDKKVN
jgi:Putative zinc-finger